MIIVLVKNLFGTDLGYGEELGLIYPKGSRLDTLLLLPGLEQKLLSEGFAVPEGQQQASGESFAKAKQAPQNKRRRSPFSNK